MQQAMNGAQFMLFHFDRVFSDDRLEDQRAARHARFSTGPLAYY
jgi:hypothetical protein